MKRVLKHIGLMAYVWVTIAAFIYTMVRVRVPLIPRTVLIFSYGMMAPYQGYEEVNEDMYAEGLLQTGEWEPIDLDRFYPFVLGERVFRREIGRSTYPTNDAEQVLRDRTFATHLQAVLTSLGQPYSAVRIFHDMWPVSPQSFTALRTSPFLSRTFVLQVP